MFTHKILLHFTIRSGSKNIFKFGRTFDSTLDTSDGQKLVPRKMMNFRGGYSENGFFFCGLQGPTQGVTNEVSY